MGRIPQSWTAWLRRWLDIALTGRVIQVSGGMIVYGYRKEMGDEAPVQDSV